MRGRKMLDLLFAVYGLNMETSPRVSWRHDKHTVAFVKEGELFEKPGLCL